MLLKLQGHGNKFHAITTKNKICKQNFETNFLCCKWDSWKNPRVPTALYEQNFCDIVFNQSNLFTTNQSNSLFSLIKCIQNHKWRRINNFVYTNFVSGADTETNFGAIEIFKFYCNRMEICFRVPKDQMTPWQSKKW